MYDWFAGKATYARQGAVVPLVSKQFYDEALSASWGTHIFHFNNAWDYENFTRRHFTRVQHIRRLKISLGPERFSTERMTSWSKALHPGNVLHLTSLQELDIKFDTFGFDLLGLGPSDFDKLMEREPGSVPRLLQSLRHVIGTFQQFKLTRGRVVVIKSQAPGFTRVKPMEDEFCNPEVRKKIAQDLRRVLLQHGPASGASTVESDAAKEPRELLS